MGQKGGGPDERPLAQPTPGTTVAGVIARAMTPPDGLPLDGPLAVAVSGGSDSLGLLLVLRDWAATRGITLHAVTVDHRLRPEAADEARFVARTAAEWAIPHDILTWDAGPAPTGNLPDQARRARYGLLTDWARDRGIAAIALGHTADDQAETLLMRLGRGAGIDGLSTMAARHVRDGVAFLRPALSLRREDLRNVLRAAGQTWVEDPSNDDDSYDRVRLRQAMPLLDELGLGVPALAMVSANLAQVRDALDHYTRAEAVRLVTQDAGGDILMPLDQWAALPPEIARRLLRAGLTHVAGPGYPPRGRALDQLMQALRAGRGQPLGGCLVQGTRNTLRITREPAAVAGLIARLTAEPASGPGAVWDGRWQLSGPFADTDEIRACGEAGLAAIPDWRVTGLPRATLMATPAVWRGDRLIAAPLAGFASDFNATLLRGLEDFDAAIRTH
ncbi:tRNA(Ile)-lysidine synthase [Pseudooceanicola nitratireducens]|uniref:tRNA(Ile)-lysidine synthase n=2 Tax=Pseudooceanicola nitratireducens TaxID=517719 RepID=A0A1I1NBF0_9RHOB|nr:tRNA(Ile)-lysidine synthase [Pseudooceanicola nitratireducens]SFC94795.1 tRNA(Ile)-lysidine synthase [Pseudooceanicola nitratireducens]